MPLLTCYRLRSQIAGHAVEDLHQAIDTGDLTYAEYGPIAGRNFTAFVLVVENVPHEPPWGPFVRSASTESAEVEIPLSNSPGALVLVEVPEAESTLRFAFAFGVLGRFLLANNGYQRGFGLRAALNIIYPAGATTVDAARLRSVDSKRRGPIILRARSQTSEASAFEEFDVDRLRDVVSAAVGVPHDTEQWGSRVSGGDPLRMDLGIEFDELGNLCLRLQAVHDREDYVEDFGWIDNIQPVTDPDLRRRLEDEIIRVLDQGAGAELTLAPPEIIDWQRVNAFRYHFDRRQGPANAPVVHPEMRLNDYLTGLRAHGLDEDLTIEKLKARRILAVDGDANTIHAWPFWACLVGEVELDDSTFVLDKGDFYYVREDYIDALDTYINAIPAVPIDMPTATPTTAEGDYNETAAEAHGYVLLDGSQRTIRIPGRTTAVEICDLLTPKRDLVHVKRHFSSSSLSHLFAQGAVSAELLQMNSDFRQRAHERVVEFAHGLPGFDFFNADALTPTEFRIVYAVMAPWAGRNAADAFPFFAKVNLRNVVEQLRSRGFGVGLRPVDTSP
ncbi:MAG: hypothetical protein GEU79_13825 [Acidimicrobiia bacterium]|nr:hypothetical protein [Acidimicrobiia bacterium]